MQPESIIFDVCAYTPSLFPSLLSPRNECNLFYGKFFPLILPSSFFHFFWPIKIQFLFFPPTSRKTGRPSVSSCNNVKTRSKSAGPLASRNGQPSYRSSSPSSSCTRGSNNVWPESFAIDFIRENFPLSLLSQGFSTVCRSVIKKELIFRKGP